MSSHQTKKQCIEMKQSVHETTIINKLQLLLYNTVQSIDIIPKQPQWPQFYIHRTHTQQSHSTHTTPTVVKQYHAYHKYHMSGSCTNNTQHINNAYNWANLIVQHVQPIIQSDAALQPYNITLSVNESNDTDKRSSGFIDINVCNIETQQHVDYTPLQLHRDNITTKYQLYSIGYIESCYKLKYCTPRQGTLVPLSRGCIRLNNNINTRALYGLDQYSHLWVLFIFSDNDNTRFRAKISPPKLDGEKIGCYASRSPHRINPIGQTLVKIDRIQNNSIYISGIDLIDNTPIIDIKPIHHSDILGYDNIRIPQWLHDTHVNNAHRLHVEFTSTALQQLTQCIDKLQFYDNLSDIKHALIDTLSLDPRETYVRNKNDSTAIWGFVYDRLNVQYRVENNTTAYIVQCEYIDPKQLSNILHEQSIQYETNSIDPPQNILLHQQQLHKKSLQTYVAAQTKLLQSNTSNDTDATKTSSIV